MATTRTSSLHSSATAAAGIGTAVRGDDVSTPSQTQPAPGSGLRTLPSAPRLQIDLHPLEAHRTDTDELFVAEWRRLFTADPQAYALQHPDHVAAELKHLPATRLHAWLISAREGSHWVGAGVLLPKRITARHWTGLPPEGLLQGYRLAGNRFLQTDDRSDVLTALAQTALDQVQGSAADFLLVEDLDQPSPLAGALASVGAGTFSQFAPQELQPRLRIELPPTADAYFSKFSSKTRSTFRRKLKKFGNSRLWRVIEPQDVARFLSDAHAISLQTWQSRRLGLRIRNDARELDQLSELARCGLLRSYVWYVNETPAAFLLGNQSAGTFHYEEVGYATEFARNSPGQMLLLQVLDDLFAANRPTWFDFGGGDAEYKRMFANHVTNSGTVWLLPPRFKPWLVTRWIQTVMATKRGVRGLVRQLGAASRVRQWIRYGGATATEARETTSTDESATESSSPRS